MKITLKQAAELLGTSSYAVRGLIRVGMLKDHSQKEGKHTIFLDSKEVAEYRKSRKSTTPPAEVRRLAETTDDGPRTEPMAKVPVVPLTGIHTRLERIEEKVDLLLKMWS